VQAPPTTNCIALGTSASPADAPIDVPDQIAANYQYDAAGNQISDASKNLTSVSWTVFGKVRRAEKTGAGFAEYRYDGLNNKTLIKVTDEDGTTHLRVVCFPYATRLFSPKKFA
jgi:hypothetical protein